MRVSRNHTAIMTLAEAGTWEVVQGMCVNPAVFRRRKTDGKDGPDRTLGLGGEPESPDKPEVAKNHWIQEPAGKRYVINTALNSSP